MKILSNLVFVIPDTCFKKVKISYFHQNIKFKLNLLQQSYSKFTNSIYLVYFLKYFLLYLINFFCFFVCLFFYFLFCLLFCLFFLFQMNWMIQIRKNCFFYAFFCVFSKISFSFVIFHHHHIFIIIIILNFYHYLTNFLYTP